MAEISGRVFFGGRDVAGRLLQVTSEDLFAVFGHGVLRQQKDNGDGTNEFN